jgi:hypothetical protein
LERADGLAEAERIAAQLIVIQQMAAVRRERAEAVLP